MTCGRSLTWGDASSAFRGVPSSASSSMRSYCWKLASASESSTISRSSKARRHLTALSSDGSSGGCALPLPLAERRLQVEGAEGGEGEGAGGGGGAMVATKHALMSVSIILHI